MTSQMDLDEDSTEATEEEADELTNEYREAAQLALVFMQKTIGYLRDSRTPKELAMRLDLVSYTLCIPTVAGMSMEELGKAHNRGRQSISNQLLAFQRGNGIPAAIAQKSIESRPAYREARLNGKIK